MDWDLALVGIVPSHYLTLGLSWPDYLRMIDDRQLSPQCTCKNIQWPEKREINWEMGKGNLNLN